MQLAIFCGRLAGHGSALSYADVKLKADKAGNCHELPVVQRNGAQYTTDCMVSLW
jgi:hypothetical protein